MNGGRAESYNLVMLGLGVQRRQSRRLQDRTAAGLTSALAAGSVAAMTASQRLHRCATMMAACLAATPAGAMVGGAREVSAPHVVTIVGSRGNFCSGTLIAPDLVLSAAHCTAPRATYKIVDGDPKHPRLLDVRRLAAHPDFDAAAILAHRATADVALLQLAEPPHGRTPAPTGVPSRPLAAGNRFDVTGIGVTVRGDGRSAGKTLTAALAATGQPGTLQIRLVDPSSNGGAGLGACTGDSGAPVSEDQGGRPVVVGVVSWSTGPQLGAGCGGLAGVAPLTLYRDWMGQTARSWGSELR